MINILKKAKVGRKKVLLRVDMNVPMDENRNITDDFRIRAAIPTIEYLLERDAKVILMSHLGRPDGKFDRKYSMDVIQDRLSEYLNVSIVKAPDCIGSKVQNIVNEMMAGDMVLLENLRFHPQEEANDLEFARSLASLGDLYINDAFGVSHRAHASVAAIAQIIPAYAGLLLDKEIRFLGGIVTNPREPFVLVMGGVKADEKLAVLEACAKKAQHICIGGVLANTILKARGIAVGRSKVAAEHEKLLQSLELADPKFHLPVDVLVTDDIDNPAYVSVKAVGAIGEDEYILDIGPETSKLFVNVIYGAQTIFWNGPLGLFEKTQFARGTETVARAIAASKGIKIAGGGETALALESLRLADSMDHISTGGGAMLDFLAGRRLPGLEALGYYD